jgi:hypothetical protein
MSSWACGATAFGVGAAVAIGAAVEAGVSGDDRPGIAGGVAALAKGIVPSKSKAAVVNVLSFIVNLTF